MVRRSSAIAVIASVGLVLSACAAPGDGSSPGSSAGSGAVDGVWRTDGYGWALSISGGRAQTYELTSVSCLPAGAPVEQLGGAESDGLVRFGTRGTAVQTVVPAAAGHARLRLLGTAADIDMTRIPELPPLCGRAVPRDPVTTFDVFWASYAENYNSTVRKGVDWNAVRARYRPMVTSSTTPDQLYRILTEMITPLGDNHASIDAGDDREFEGKRPGTRDDDEIDDDDTNEAVDAHLADLGATVRSFADDRIAYADLPGDVGYLRVNAFQDYDTEPDEYVPRAALLGRVLDTVLTPQRVRAWRGLIIDLRYNEGGDDELGLQLAGRLTDAPYLAYTKLARNDPVDPTRYGRARPVMVTPGRGTRYTGPVRLLTSDLTVSAGETFSEAMMKRTPAASRVGTTTQGVFADDMDRRLPNGWSFTVGNEDFIAPDGRNYEGPGIPPTVPTAPPFGRAELAAHQDSTLDTALRTPW